MKTTKRGQYLGEYGTDNGRHVYDVYAVRGYAEDVRRMWRALDDAQGSPEEAEIIARLVEIGAAVEQS